LPRRTRPRSEDPEQRGFQGVHDLRGFDMIYLDPAKFIFIKAATETTARR
jgi:hypothetical protein